MKRILTAVVLVPLVLLVVFLAPLWLFTSVLFLLTVLAMYEYIAIARGYGLEPFRWPMYALSLLLFIGEFKWARMSFSPDMIRRVSSFLDQGWALPFLVLLVFGIPVVFRRDMRAALTTAATSAFGLFYIAAPLASLILLRAEPYVCVLLLFILFSVWAGDIAAFYVGRSIGRYKLAPLVSPNKTWEGAIASVIASIAVAFLVFHFNERLRSMLSQHSLHFQSSPSVEDYLDLRSIHLVALGVVTNLAAQLGDLFESALKRGAQMKDSGALLPGHGGILDRIDALLFAIPAVWYYLAFYSILS